MPTSNLPSWLEKLRDAYRSHAHNQFILHGNVQDQFFLSEQKRLETLTPYLQESLLAQFEIVITYGLASGLKVHRGGELIQAAEDNANRLSFQKQEAPETALSQINQWIYRVANLGSLKSDKAHSIAVIIENCDLIFPASAARSINYPLASMALMVKEWSSNSNLRRHPLATFLITENKNDLHPLLANNSRCAPIEVPLPAPELYAETIEHLTGEYPEAFNPDEEASLVEQLQGITLSTLQELTCQAQHQKQPLSTASLSSLKKESVEKACQGLITFIPPKRNFSNIHGFENIKKWIRNDLQLWQKGLLEGVPKGYLLCGPVGTGKTYLAQCIAGEAGIPMVVLNNFRDKYVGSTEGNLEKVFRQLKALGRCLVFIDEADQTLGKRNTSGDSGLSGRIYSMIAQEMGAADNRGKILWVLASSRPDLIEVDLKRPGRIDTKFPLLPTTTAQASLDLIEALCQNKGLSLTETEAETLLPEAPLLLTPGAAETLAAQCYRLTHTQDLTPAQALTQLLKTYHPPVSPDVLQEQIELAIDEATHRDLVPDFFRRAKGS